MSHSDKRSLWQVAEILGWSQTDLGRVRDFYCQPPILLAFAPFFEFRLADGLKKGYRASKVAALAFGALQGLDGKNYIGEIDEIEDPTIGDFDVWFTIRLIEVCRAQGGVWEHNADLQQMVENAVQIGKVLNKQYERLVKQGTNGAELPNQMVKEAQKLGIDLDIGSGVAKQPGRGPQQRKRISATRSNIRRNTATIIPSVVQSSPAEEPSVFQNVYEKFKETYNYTETLSLFRFSVIQLYYTMQLEGEQADLSTSFFDKFIYLRPIFMKLREGLREPVHPDTYLNWVEREKIEVIGFGGVINWEFVKDVSNTEEGLAFLEEYEKLVAKGLLFQGAEDIVR